MYSECHNNRFMIPIINVDLMQVASALKIVASWLENLLETKAMSCYVLEEVGAKLLEEALKLLWLSVDNLVFQQKVMNHN